MKVGIEVNGVSYTPESYAYLDYLEAKGCCVQLADRAFLSTNNDINILYAGVFPFWSKNSSVVEIHEYQSLSVPPFSRAKDIFKCAVNSTPSGRIFLNEIVQSKLKFLSDVPSIRRDMGVDEGFFSIDALGQATHDILYCGSISGRRGLVGTIFRLAKLGFKVLVVGSVESCTRTYLEKAGVEFTGRLERKDLFDVYRSCRYGLNYTPDEYPFNIQTSTKTLEYLAAGLGLISNRYQWSEEFCSRLQIDVIWIEDLLGGTRNLDECGKFRLSRDEYSWNSILDNSGFFHFLKTLLR